MKDRHPFLLITSHVDMPVERLRQQIDSIMGAAVLDIVKWYIFCAFDIIGDLAFGESIWLVGKSGVSFMGGDNHLPLQNRSAMLPK